MNRLSFRFILVTLGLHSFTVSALDTKKMVQACIEQGELTGVCECSVSKWAKTITSDETTAADKMISMMSSNQPPSPAMMSSITNLLSRFQKLGMECAMVAIDDEDNSTPDIRDFLPKDALSDDDAMDLNALVSGHGNVMDSINAMTQRDEARTEQQRQQRRLQEEQQTAKVEALEKRIRTEQERLDKTLPLSKMIDDYKHIIRLKAERSGYKNTDCVWEQLVQAAGNDKAGVLAAYFASVGGPDFDQPSAHQPYLKSAYEKYNQYTSARKKCQ